MPSVPSEDTGHAAATPTGLSSGTIEVWRVQDLNVVSAWLSFTPRFRNTSRVAVERLSV